ncbi:MAG: 16S rRNA (cytosine(1402)-N(4))-methyltransferase, partial [Pseudonocardiaceae bacterium]|nr:16S rRNA (cytosine(1402)-N(4))-methyltransferase [Pseudonocardiaceae bacterium]
EQATPDEIESNPRAASVRLRAAERIAPGPDRRSPRTARR